MVAGMKPGSVIVDMAAAMGGNVEGSKAGQTVVTVNGVKIIGDTNLPALMAGRRVSDVRAQRGRVPRRVRQGRQGQPRPRQRDPHRGCGRATTATCGTNPPSQALKAQGS
jgi:hypothetical protein